MALWCCSAHSRPWVISSMGWGLENKTEKRRCTSPGSETVCYWCIHLQAPCVDFISLSSSNPVFPFDLYLKRMGQCVSKVVGHTQLLVSRKRWGGMYLLSLRDGFTRRSYGFRILLLRSGGVVQTIKPVPLSFYLRHRRQEGSQQRSAGAGTEW